MTELPDINALHQQNLSLSKGELFQMIMDGLTDGMQGSSDRQGSVKNGDTNAH